jgi:hypothetical protein
VGQILDQLISVSVSLFLQHPELHVPRGPCGMWDPSPPATRPPPIEPSAMDIARRLPSVCLSSPGAPAAR